MLQSGDINGTVTHLRAAERGLGAIPENNENYPSVQKVLTSLVTDAVTSLDNGDNSEALIYLNLAEQQLGSILLYTRFIHASAFLTYSNHRYKMRINYQYDWIIDGNSYPTELEVS